MAKAKQYHTRNLYFSNRVLEALTKIFEYPMTIVEAPMGYGKTTAVKEYLKKSCATVLWQTIYDHYGNSFWTAFYENFGELDKGCAQSLGELGLPNDRVSRLEALKIIEKIPMTNPTVIVIDDYYLVDDPEVHEFMVFLIKNEIPNLHIVLTTRHRLFEQLGEFKLKGYVHHITKRELELTANEVIHYYKACGIHLKVDSANRLYDYTEGWISALYLWMLKLVEGETIENIIEEDRGVLRATIYELLDYTVYSPLDQEMKTFLLSLCILDKFTIEEAAYLWGRQNTQVLLQELLAKNAFITYDFKTKTYRMHKMLTHFLTEHFHNEDSICKEVLYKRAGEWSLKTGNALVAMVYFYRAKAFDAMLEALEMDKGNSIFIEQKDLVIKYFEECPEEIKVRHPIALLVYAMCLFTFNEIGLFEKVCGEFVHSLQKDPAVLVDAGVDVGKQEWLLGEYELLMSFADYNNIVKMTEHLKKACALLKEPSVFMDTRGGWTFGAPSVLYMFYREPGQLFKSVGELKQSMPYYYKITNGHGMGADYSMEAEWYLNLGELENAEMIAHKALYVASEKHQSEIVICALFVQARCALIKGDFPKVLMALEEMRGQIHKEKMYSLMHTLDLCEAYIYGLLGEVQKIPEWIIDGDFHSQRLYFPAKAFANIVYGRVLLIKGEYLRLIGIAEEFQGLASVFPNLLAKIYTQIYLAGALEKICRRSAALLALRQALEMSIEDQVYMPLVENGDYIEPLLRELGKETIYQKEIDKILQLVTAYEKEKKEIKAHYFGQKRPSLTKREKEIAKLVADGFTNKEISQILFLSENTVKAQLKSIFEKLEISSRVLLAAKIN